MREGDIESLRRRMKDEGRPIKSDTIVKGNKKIYYKVKKNGRVEITHKDT